MAGKQPKQTSETGETGRAARSEGPAAMAQAPAVENSVALAGMAGNTLSIGGIWDSIFGTYRVPRNIRPLRYGVDEDVPNTLRGQLRFPVAALPPARALARHPWRALRSAIGGARAIATGVRRSTTRPRRPYPRPGEPWPWATVPPLGHRRD